MAAPNMQLPIQWNGDPDMLLKDLEDVPEFKHVAHDALSRGLQKPPIMTETMYADGVSASIDYNLSGLKNQDAILAGIPNADRYQRQTQTQAYRRLWLEAVGKVPTAEEMLVFAYSGITYDPRLGKIVKEDPGNMYSSVSSDLGSLAKKSIAAFSQKNYMTPSDYVSESRPLRAEREYIRSLIIAGKAGVKVSNALAAFAANHPNSPLAQTAGTVATVIGGFLDGGTVGLELWNKYRDQFAKAEEAFVNTRAGAPSALGLL